MEEEIRHLPEICVACILSFTTPLDACRLAAVSTIWRSAADSDFVWERLLPSDYLRILARAVNRVEYSSLKELFFRFSESILIDKGSRRFSLKRSNGKKSFTVSARKLDYNEEDSPGAWEWISTPEPSSRVWDELGLLGDPPRSVWFAEMGLLRLTDTLELRGKFPRRMLSAMTYYAVRLLFRITSSSFGLHDSLTVVVKDVDWRMETRRKVQFDSCFTRRWRPGQLRPSVMTMLFPSHEDPVFRPEVADPRDDGWMELEMGRIWCDPGEDEDEEEEEDDEYECGKKFAFFLLDRGLQRKCGLLLEGIELWPLN